MSLWEQASRNRIYVLFESLWRIKELEMLICQKRLAGKPEPRLVPHWLSQHYAYKNAIVPHYATSAA